MPSTPEPDNHEPAPKPISLFALFWVIVFIVLIGLLGLVSLGFIFFGYLNQPPTEFPVNVPITITEGTSAKAITKMLDEAGYVRSELALYLQLIIWHDPSSIKASTYNFPEPLSTKQIAEELTRGRFSDNLRRLTHIEGESAEQIAKRATDLLPKFDGQKFLVLAAPYEGKLFPDTYLLPENYTEEELLQLLLDTFSERVAPLQTQIAQQSLSLPEILILASILEREANSPESKRLVSGILQRRLKIGMPLQVDASMEYYLDKPLQELTPEDLEIDTPYNTYLYAGLPPTPIGNPGLDAILAVLEPTSSDYLFYITGADGEFYYARDFDEHRRNIARHLR